MSPEGADLFVQRTSDAMHEQIAIMYDQTQDRVFAAWRERNPGQEPNDMQTVGLHNQIRLSTQEIVRSQLWEGYVPTPDPGEGDEESEWEPAEDTPAMRRWQTEFAIPADRETEKLVERVWPAMEPAWQVLAELLIRARIEDRLEVPDSPDHPLVKQLEQLVEGDVARRAAIRAAAGL
ncbi:MAG: hypothetical protein WAV90_26140 [Gordonia amarae]